MLSEEQIKQNDDIPDSEVKADIADTEKEVKDLSDELEILQRNPHLHKVRIYTLRGGISNRQQFIKDLNQILEYRNKK